MSRESSAGWKPVSELFDEKSESSADPATEVPIRPSLATRISPSLGGTGGRFAEFAERARKTAEFGDWDGGRLRRARLAAGLTQPELAKVLGSNDTTISYWENNKYYPSPFWMLSLTEFIEAIEAAIAEGSGKREVSR